MSPACDLSRANHFVQIVSSFSIIFWDPPKKKSSTLFVCCNQKTPWKFRKSKCLSVCVCVCLCDIDRITNPKGKNSNQNTRAGSSGIHLSIFPRLVTAPKNSRLCVCVYVYVCVWSFTDQFTPWDTSTHRLVSQSVYLLEEIHSFFCLSWPEFSLHPGISISNSRSVIFAQFVFFGLNSEKIGLIGKIFFGLLVGWAAAGVRWWWWCARMEKRRSSNPAKAFWHSSQKYFPVVNVRLLRWAGSYD